VRPGRRDVRLFEERLEVMGRRGRGVIVAVICRDADPGSSRHALSRIDAILAAAEQVATLERPRSLAAIGLLQAASVIAATGA
jgi:hypothetical protein